MPRRPRIDLAGYPLHVVQRGNNRAACFFSDNDRRSYLTWLGEYAALFGEQIHAWVLMTNHVHLLVSCESSAAISRTMQALGRQYVGHVNRSRGRTGTLWEGRYKSCAIDSSRYLLDCMRYIELNPVRAGVVGDPADFRWSSYRRNALGIDDPLVTEHEVYLSQAESPKARRTTYRAGFTMAPDASLIGAIRSATSSGHLLAEENVRRQLERRFGPILGPATRGRPKKSSGRSNGFIQIN